MGGRLDIVRPKRSRQLADIGGTTWTKGVRSTQGPRSHHGGHTMATYRHPVTGVILNEINITNGPISEIERRTARLLLDEGHARWVVAAMLGRFPLAFNGTGTKPPRPRKVTGGDLPLNAAKSDPRQLSMDDFWNDLFGDDTRENDA